MREIKFRAWDSLTKRMWTPDFVSQQGLAGMSLGTKAHPNDLVYDKDRFPVMQYTGLKDKDDKEIYEGDILRQTESVFCMPVVFQSVVEYQPGGFWFRGIDFNITDCNWHQFNAQNREVIGNIYENPELLNP